VEMTLPVYTEQSNFLVDEETNIRPWNSVTPRNRDSQSESEPSWRTEVSLYTKSHRRP
jgi:hypothetical protein